MSVGRTTWYHGTKPEAWKAIQAEGVLWGWPCPRCCKQLEGECVTPRQSRCSDRRYTYLTPDLSVAREYGPVILEVEYQPVGVDGTGTDNYGFDPPPEQTCWQFSVFVPIPLSAVTVYSPKGD